MVFHVDENVVAFLLALVVTNSAVSLLGCPVPNMMSRLASFELDVLSTSLDEVVYMP